jgi:hypothetical protein
VTCNLKEKTMNVETSKSRRPLSAHAIGRLYLASDGPIHPAPSAVC